MIRDFYHQCVRKALEKDGWTITHDPFPINIGRIGYEVDLGAEKVIAAEKGPDKIAVEVKSFVGPSDINEFHRAMGSSTITEPTWMSSTRTGNSTWLFH